MSGMRRYAFTEDIYKTALVLLIGGDRNKYLLSNLCVTEEFLSDSAGRRAEGMYFRVRPEDNTNDNNCSVIWLKEPSIPQLVHELLHFCNQVFLDNGIDRSHKFDEAYTYYVEHWVRKISKKVKLKA